MTEGDVSPTITFGPVTRRQIARYAGASGDFNPAHTDEAFATKVGMPSVFAHGLLQTGVLARLAADWLGQANVTSYGTRFTGQVWPGDVLTYSGRVEHIEDGIVHCAFTVTNQDGATVLTGRATAKDDNGTS